LEKKSNLFVESLKLQQEIFGNELFMNDIDMNTPEPFETNSSVEAETLFIAGEFETAKSLDELDKMICDCMECPLGQTRNKFVFGKGNPDAKVMCIGEGPGAEEDAKGEPFVGRAGQLLTDILKAIKFSREEVYIANIVKCRPPGNRTPSPDEMEKCIPYLMKQIELIKPSLILCLGLTAAQALIKRKDTLTNFRGKVFDVKGIKTMVTYHPAALLRNPNWKKGCWEDVQAFRKLYDEL
jgi:DNA polymerase